MRNEVRAICEKCNDAVIVANYGVFSTGVSIKNLHHIIFGESIKSKITTLQSIGRALRLHLSKEKAELYDIIDLLEHKGKKNLIGKHAESRMEIYEKEGFKVKTWETSISNFDNKGQKQ
jgi:superfamily II DNA or RNA helicase